MYSIVDVSSGADVFVADGRALAGPRDNCADLTDMTFPSAGVIGVSMSNRDGRKPVDAYDFANHRKVQVPPETKWADPRSSLIGVNTGGKDYAYETHDSVTGGTLFAVSVEKGEALNFMVKQLFNKQLFVETTDEKLVVDASTGATLSRGWTAYPVEMADDWVLDSDGKFAKQ